MDLFLGLLQTRRETLHDPTLWGAPTIVILPNSGNMSSLSQTFFRSLPTPPVEAVGNTGP